MGAENYQFFDRELSWLSFNYRVLQEAQNPSVPLFERIKFMAIYSSNLDEFYRVRVALYQHAARIEKKEGKKAKSAQELLKKIRREVIKQQDAFGKVFHGEILSALRSVNIHLINHKQLSHKQKQFLEEEYGEKVVTYTRPITIGSNQPIPFLENRQLYFYVKTISKNSNIQNNYFLNIPSEHLGRFIELPPKKGKGAVMLLDEAVKYFLKDIFPKEKTVQCFQVKMSRDAELYLEEESGNSMVEKIKESLHKRKIGSPSRFLFDEKIPSNSLKLIKKALKLKKEELIPGGIFHNFHDLFQFPIPEGSEHNYEELPNLQNTRLAKFQSYFKALQNDDHLLHFPYQNYSQAVQFIEEASHDPKVSEIKITLYRVAKNSKICTALIRAAQSGKSVVVFNEVKARFDEESNIFWGEELEKAGAKVLYSFDNLKVHTKLCLVTRKERTGNRFYGYLGTGNFNEKTSNIYCDHALLTSKPELTLEVEKVFDYLQNPKSQPVFDKLFVAPFNMRASFISLIDFEIKQAKQGKRAEIILKMNSLEDRIMISKLYEASLAGVKIKIIVRGICCLIPGAPYSKNIKVYSIVDRYLEHARIYHFHHGGSPKLYLASADWMKRNLSSRVEVGFPVESKKLYKELLTLLRLQLKDNTKSRLLNITQSNPFKKSKALKTVQAQKDFHEFLKARYK